MVMEVVMLLLMMRWPRSLQAGTAKDGRVRTADQQAAARATALVVRVPLLCSNRVGALVPLLLLLLVMVQGRR